MKLLSKTLARIVGITDNDVLEEDNMGNDTILIIFNQGYEKYEFAECGNCKTEMEPQFDDFEKGLATSLYPYFCPKCKRRFIQQMRAEEVE